MSIFPTTILLATDGSREARLATRTATDLAENTASELHLVYVWQMPYVFHPEVWYCGLYEKFEGEALRCLEARVQEAQWAGVSVAATHLRVGVSGGGDSGRGGGGRSWADSDGQQGPWQGAPGPDGQRLRFCGWASPLPRFGGPRVSIRHRKPQSPNVPERLSEKSR
jgi:hypothetical protein